MEKVWAFGKKYQIIIFLSVIVAILTIVKITYQAPVEEKTTTATEVSQQTISPTPTPAPSPTSSIISTTASGSAQPTLTQNEEALYEQYKDVINEKLPLWQKLPYENKYYIVEKYTAPLRLLVTIKVGSVDEAKNAVQLWMIKQGVDPATHEIDFQRAADWKL